METMKMMQGDSRILSFSIFLNGEDAISPDTAEDIEVCIGNEDGALIRKIYSGGDVAYDASSGKWALRLSQQETLDLDPDIYDVIARVKFGDDVYGVNIGRIMILDGQSEEVI